jgi:hypothetical protein
MGVFPSRFCNVLHKQPPKIQRRQASDPWPAPTASRQRLLTLRLRSPAGARRSPCGRIRRRSAARCSCSCRRRPRPRRPRGGPGRTAARRSRRRSGGLAFLQSPPRPCRRPPPRLSSGPVVSRVSQATDDRATAITDGAQCSATTDLDVADAGGVVDDGLVLVLAFLLPGGFFLRVARRADAHRTPELLQSFRVVPVPGRDSKRLLDLTLSSHMMGGWMGTSSNAERFKEGLLSADFIMAAGPPASISSRMGLSDGSSFMRATRASSCSLLAGLVSPPSIVAMAGSCISALPIRSAIATNCGFCISCCIVATYFCGSSSGAGCRGDATVFCSCWAICVNAGSLEICSAISLMLGSCVCGSRSSP